MWARMLVLLLLIPTSSALSVSIEVDADGDADAGGPVVLPDAAYEDGDAEIIIPFWLADADRNFDGGVTSSELSWYFGGEDVCRLYYIHPDYTVTLDPNDCVRRIIYEAQDDLQEVVGGHLQ